MKNYDESVEINYNPNFLYILDHIHRILIICDLGSDKTNVLPNLIKDQRPDIDKIYLYIKDLFESKNQLLINEIEKEGIKIKNPKSSYDYLQTMDDAHENLGDYNSTKKKVNSV